MTDYPGSLPAPQIEGYQVEIDYGTTGVTFENGNRRQRKGFRKERHFFQYSLVLDINELWTWQSWANQYGYDWHYEDMVSNYSGTTGKALIPHYIRYISDINIEPVDRDYFRVSLQAEMDLNTLPTGTIVVSGNWYVARTPSNPPTDRILAGTPAAPSANIIIAGTPGTPAA